MCLRFPSTTEVSIPLTPISPKEDTTPRLKWDTRRVMMNFCLSEDPNRVAGGPPKQKWSLPPRSNKQWTQVPHCQILEDVYFYEKVCPLSTYFSLIFRLRGSGKQWSEECEWHRTGWSSYERADRLPHPLPRFGNDDVPRGQTAPSFARPHRPLKPRPRSHHLLSPVQISAYSSIHFLPDFRPAFDEIHK